MAVLLKIRARPLSRELATRLSIYCRRAGSAFCRDCGDGTLLPVRNREKLVTIKSYLTGFIAHAHGKALINQRY